MHQTVTRLIQGYNHRLVSLAEGGIETWNLGFPLVSALCARAIVESVCSTYFVLEKSKALVEAKDLKALWKFLRGQLLHYKRMMSGRNDITPMPSIGKLVDHFANSVYGADKKLFVDSYDQLSQYAHPNWPGTVGFFSRVIRSENRQYFDLKGNNNDLVLDELLLAYLHLGFYVEYAPELETIFKDL